MCVSVYWERERERERGPGRLSSFWAKHWPESRSLQDHVMDQPFQSTQKSIWASNPFEAFLYSSIIQNKKAQLLPSMSYGLYLCLFALPIWLYGLSLSLDIRVDYFLVFNIVLSYVSNAPMFALSDTTTFSK